MVSNSPVSKPRPGGAGIQLLFFAEFFEATMGTCISIWVLFVRPSPLEILVAARAREILVATEWDEIV